MNHTPAARHPDDPPGFTVTPTGGRITLRNPGTDTEATLLLPQAVGLASALASVAATQMTTAAPELADALWAASQRLHEAVAAWQPQLYPTPALWHPNPYADGRYPAVPATVTARCDNTSVGVLITDDQGRYLLIQRVRPPVGIAPVAGHVDQHGTPEDAARAEVAEEVGLTVTALTPLIRRWRTNVCRRHHGPSGPGHDWTVYHAETTGTVATDPADPRWYSREKLQELADRTMARARGELDDAEYAAAPGLEPVWVEFLAELCLVDVPLPDLAAVNALASRSPYA